MRKINIVCGGMPIGATLGALMLQCNNAASGTAEAIQVNINAQVNSASIRRETHNGREHWVVPGYTLPFDVVMNGGLYPKDEILKHYKKLEGTVAPMGHPTVNGQHVSALSPEGLNVGYVGAFNRNVRLAGNRVAVEKWVDVEFAKNTPQGKRLLDRLAQIESGDVSQPIHTSIAVFLQREIVLNKAAGYDWVARISSVDHDAILLDEPGAATPEQGVGMMVNSAEAKALVANAGLFRSESLMERRERVEAAARAKFASAPDAMAWVEDLTEDQVIVHTGGGEAQMYGYRTENGGIVFDDAGTPVERQTSWVARSKKLLANAVNSLLHSPGLVSNQARPDSTKDVDMPITDQEKADLAKAISESLAANVKASVEAAVVPVTQRLTALEANNKALSDSLTANSRAADEAKRAAVAVKFGMSAEGVAALQGNALEELYKQCDSAAPVGKEAPAPTVNKYAPPAADKLAGYFGPQE